METEKQNMLEDLIPPEQKGVKIDELAACAKSNCKKCYGRGYQKYVHADGTFERYEVCKCARKSEKLKELFARIYKTEQKKEEKPEKVEEKSQEIVEENCPSGHEHEHSDECMCHEN